MVEESLRKTLKAIAFLLCLFGGWLLLSTTSSYTLFWHFMGIAFSASETQWMVVLCLVGDVVTLMILECRCISTYNRNFTTSYERGRFRFGRNSIFTANICLSVLILLALLRYGLVYRWALFPPQAMALLLMGMVLGKWAKLFLKGGRRTVEEITEFRKFLIILVLLLAFLSAGRNYYYNGRWMGFWDNPNNYGVLMGAGVVLAAGLLGASLKSRVHSPQSQLQSPTSPVQSPKSKNG